MDQPKIERVLRLMKMMSGPVDYSIDEMARRLGTSYRSIYRYIDTFKDAGFVVYKTERGFYKLGVDKKDNPLNGFDDLIHFTEDEAQVFNQLLDALDDANALKQGLRRKLSTVYECTSMTANDTCHRNADNLQAVREAINARRCVVLHDYSSAHSGAVRDRNVEPFGFTQNYAHIICYDLDDGRVKLFKTQRVGSVSIADKPWTHEDEHKEVFIDVFRLTGFDPKEVEVGLSLRARNLLLEEYPQAQPFVSQDAPNHWMLRTRVAGFAGIGRFVLGLHAEVQVYGCEEFKTYLRQQVSQMAF